MPRQAVRDFGTCLKFAAGSNNVNIGNPANIKAVTNITLSAWVRPLNNTRADIVGHWKSGSDYHFLLTHGLSANLFHFYISTTGSNTNFAVSTTKTVFGNWYHVVGTYDGVNIRIYVNGVLEATVPQTGNLYTGCTDNMYIGQSGDGNNATAYIDDVLIGNNALDQQGINDLFYGAHVQPSNAVSRWKLDEASGSSAVDSAGSNNGTITGATYSTDVFMISRTATGTRQLARDFGTCISLTGSTGSYGSVPHAAILNPTTGLSISAWVKFRAWYTGTCLQNLVVAKGFDASNGFYGIGQIDPGGCGAPTGIKRARTVIRFSDGTASGAAGTTNIAYLLNQWAHLLATYDGANIKLYLNGVLEASTPIVKTLGTVNDSLFFGKQNGGSFSYECNALIDDVVLCNQAMTQTEVDNLYYSGTIPSSATNRWKFDEGSGTTLNDSIGSNNGTLTGGSYSTDVFIKPRIAAS